MIAVLKLAGFGGGKLFFLTFERVIHRRGEEDAKNPIFQHFLSPKVVQRNHLSPEPVSVSGARARNGCWWQIYSSRFLPSASCPEHVCSQRRAARSVPHALGAGRDAREDGFCFVGTRSVLPCCERARHGNTRFCKAETLRRKTHTQIAPGQAAGGACLESISWLGRKGLLHTCANAERPLQRESKDVYVLQLDRRSGWALPSPRLLAETNFCGNVSWY